MPDLDGPPHSNAAGFLWPSNVRTTPVWWASESPALPHSLCFPRRGPPQAPRLPRGAKLEMASPTPAEELGEDEEEEVVLVPAAVLYRPATREVWEETAVIGPGLGCRRGEPHVQGYF